MALLRLNRQHNTRGSAQFANAGTFMPDLSSSCLVRSKGTCTKMRLAVMNNSGKSCRAMPHCRRCQPLPPLHGTSPNHLKSGGTWSNPGYDAGTSQVFGEVAPKDHSNNQLATKY